MNKRKLDIRLKGGVKIFLYKKFVFYKIKSLFYNFRFRIFSKLMLYQFLFDFTESSFKMLRTRILMVNSRFLYLDTAQKYTVLKPRYKAFIFFFKRIKQKEFLVSSSYNIFLEFLGLRVLRAKLFGFSNSFIKFLSFDILSSWFSAKFFRKLVFFLRGERFRYVFYRVLKLTFSRYQKKISFIQFNIFLKNINNTLKSNI